MTTTLQQLNSATPAEALRLLVAGRPAHHRRHGSVIAHDPVHTLFLVPGAGPNPGIPGNYLHGSVLELSVDPASPHATRWIFGRYDLPLEQLPGDTSLRRATKALMLAGGSIGSAYGRLRNEAWASDRAQ